MNPREDSRPRGFRADIFAFARRNLRFMRRVHLVTRIRLRE
jgi:hypothetical protein